VIDKWRSPRLPGGALRGCWRRRPPDGQFPLRVGDGDEQQIVGPAAQQPVAFGDHLVPVAAAREPTTVAARRGGAEIGLALLPVRFVLQLTGAIESPGHQTLPSAALLRRLKVWEAHIGHDLALPTISTTKFAGSLHET
jgi:hypothetical protein